MHLNVEKEMFLHMRDRTNILFLLHICEENDMSKYRKIYKLPP